VVNQSEKDEFEIEREDLKNLMTEKKRDFTERMEKANHLP
jgi:hypothetical protein